MNFYEPYDQALSAEERSLVKAAEKFCEGAFSDELLLAYRESRPYAASWIQSWADAGFLGLQVQKKHGGQEASFLCKVRIAQVMAEHGFAAAFAINNLQGTITRLSRNGSSIQQSELLELMLNGSLLSAPVITEPSGGCDLAALRLSAEPVDGGWMISGEKDWITNGTLLGCAVLLAKVKGIDGQEKIASFLTRFDGQSTVQRKEIDLPGGLSFRLARLTFSNHFVPEWGLYAEPHQALKFMMEAINAARVHVAGMCVASLHSALKEAVQYCSLREAFGKPVIDHQGLRWELAEVALRLEAANALVFKAALAINDGMPAQTIAAQAKKFAVDTSIWGIDQCIRAMGAVGASGQHRLSMLLSEVRMSAFSDGTNEMLLDRIGKDLLATYGQVKAT